MNMRRILLPITIASAFTLFLLAVVYVATPRFQSNDFLDQWQKNCDAAKVDRMERQNRLVSGVETLDEAMNRFVQHEFMGYETVERVNGWYMTTESGKSFHRATLQRQAEVFDVLGHAAVPDLIRWLKHDQMEIRYIANFSLNQITGIKPYFPTFATLQEHQDGGWLANATAEYDNWFSQNHKTPTAR